MYNTEKELFTNVKTVENK